MSEGKKSCGGKFAIGAIFGAIAGTVAGVVMAPKSGEETRKDIKAASDKFVNDAKKKGNKWFKRGKKEVKRLEAETRTKVEETKKAAEKAIEDIKD